MAISSNKIAEGYAEFEFDLPGALLEQLVGAFERLAPVALNSSNVTQIVDAQGVYQVFLDNALVYVGKTDAEAGLRKRLARHAKKISSRRNLDPARVTFRAIRIFVFTAMDLESDLIRHFGGVKRIAWNGSGFGSNDPGRERDTTRIKNSNFDALYPIDIDCSLDFSIADAQLATDAIIQLKSKLPYTFRVEGSKSGGRGPHPELIGISLSKLVAFPTCRMAVVHIVSHLPPGWQATALRGYVILYKEFPRDYPDAEVIAHS